MKKIMKVLTLMVICICMIVGCSANTNNDNSSNETKSKAEDSIYKFTNKYEKELKETYGEEDGNEIILDVMDDEKNISLTFKLGQYATTADEYDLKYALMENEEGLRDDMIDTFNRVLYAYKKNGYDIKLELNWADITGKKLATVSSDKEIGSDDVERIISASLDNLEPNPGYEYEEATNYGNILALQTEMGQTLYTYFGDPVININGKTVDILYNNIPDETVYLINQGRWGAEEFDDSYWIICDYVHQIIGEEFDVRLRVIDNGEVLYKR